MEKIEIDFNNDNDAFEEKSDNIMSVSVMDSDGKKIPPKQVRVELSLSKNAMIGLGTELIRRAMQEKYTDKHWHLDPTIRGDIDNACQEMGVLLHPDSPEVIITQGEVGDLFQILEQNQNS